MGKGVAIGASIFVIILVIGGGLLYYSYTQIQVTLTDVDYHSIDWATISWQMLLSLGLNALSGNWLGAAFDLIDGINLDLEFAMHNGGLLPVYIPNLSYDVLVNDVSVGRGYSNVDMTINPGQTKTITSLQNIQKNSLAPAVGRIVANDGVIVLKVEGTAHFKLWFLDIPVPFESTKSVSIKDEIRKKLSSEIERLKPKPVEKIASTVKSFVDRLDGNVRDLDLRLSGNYIVNDTFRIGPGGYYYVGFTSSCSFNLQGGFIVNAALGDDIYVYVVDDDDFKKFEADRDFSVYYQSGKVEYDTFDKNLSAGKYYIIMSNHHSLFSTKTVQLEAATSCR